MSWNPVNDWIRAGDTHEEKKKRRFIVAAVCGIGAAALLVAGPIGWVGSAILGVVAVVKVKNALTDES